MESSDISLLRENFGGNLTYIIKKNKCGAFCIDQLILDNQTMLVTMSSNIQTNKWSIFSKIKE